MAGLGQAERRDGTAEPAADHDHIGVVLRLLRGAGHGPNYAAPSVGVLHPHVHASLGVRLLHGACVVLIVRAGVFHLLGARRRARVPELDRGGLLVRAASVFLGAGVFRSWCFAAFHGSGTRLGLRTAYC